MTERIAIRRSAAAFDNRSFSCAIARNPKANATQELLTPCELPRNFKHVAAGLKRAEPQTNLHLQTRIPETELCGKPTLSAKDRDQTSFALGVGRPRLWAAVSAAAATASSCSCFPQVLLEAFLLPCFVGEGIKGTQHRNVCPKLL